MKVKPREGLTIRDPRTLIPLPPEGKRVPDSSYWQRRIRCGDVVIVEESPSMAPTKKTEPKKTEPKKTIKE